MTDENTTDDTQAPEADEPQDASVDQTADAEHSAEKHGLKQEFREAVGQGAQIQPGAADDDRHMSAGANRVHPCVGEAKILRDIEGLRERDFADEVVRRSRAECG